MPGVLPVLNRKALEYAVRMALAVDCEVNPKSVFARKNYFYPDLPKGYQISQYESPLAEHGRLTIDVHDGTRDIGITRIHMEDDAGKSIHSPVENMSFVDLNRTGVPLIEIVSEPDIRSPEEAAAYLRGLHAILLYLGICDGNMEEGSFRCDANVSIRPRGRPEFGVRTELKNMNSFRNVQAAIAYEISRQEDLIADGETVVQETRLFDASKGITHTMRGKEEAHDYRYFPDPDLVPAVVDEEWRESIRRDLPELPRARRLRFAEQYGLPEQDCEVLTSDRGLADYFEAAVKAYGAPKNLANWIMTEVLRELRQAEIRPGDAKFSPDKLAELARIVDEDKISLKTGKQIFPELFEKGLSPAAYVEEKGLVQISDASALETAVDEVLAENPDEVAAYKGGKTKLMGYFVGQVMRKTKGQANPKLVNEILGRKLS
jgi:aspartyl-tRNA(Asn)/glutamyl-tRNA(Gln) amidotransferase subunit B